MIEKYSTVKIKCLKTSKLRGYVESHQNIYPYQLEEKLNQLVEAGWTQFEVILEGNKRSVVKINKNPCRVGNNQKPPVESNVDDDENVRNTRSKPSAGLYGTLTEEEFLDSLAQCKSWPPRREKQKRK